jgi:hypothetical protein
LKLRKSLDKLEQDIYDLLKANEPNTLLWREIVEELWPKYTLQYKSERNFGVAVSQKLRSLKDKHKLVKKKGDRWGTLQAVWPNAKKELASTDDVWKKRASDEALRILRMTTSANDDEVIQSPEATLNLINTLLPEKQKRKLAPDVRTMHKLMKLKAERRTIKGTRFIYFTIGKKFVPGVLKKILSLADEKESTN